jgi:hypothetical protein
MLSAAPSKLKQAIVTILSEYYNKDTNWYGAILLSTVIAV